MTDKERINELIIAVGYALDAADPDRYATSRIESKKKAEQILMRIIEGPAIKEPDDRINHKD